MYVVLDGSTGYKTIEDIATTCFSFFKNSCFVLTNPQGNALYQGLPILTKLSINLNGSFMVFSSVKEFIESVKIGNLYILDKVKGEIEVPKPLDNDAILFPDNKTKEAKFKLDIDNVKYFKGLNENLTISSEASILLYKIKEIL